jgi:hypothetical protein
MSGLPLPWKSAIVSRVHDRQVELAVVGKVADGHLFDPVEEGALRPDGNDEGIGLERAIAVAPQYFHGIVQTADNGQVRLAIAVEVAHGKRGRSGQNGRGDGGLERAIPVAEEHAHAADAVGQLALVQNDNVLVSIAEVCRHDRLWAQTNGECDRRSETNSGQTSILQRFQGQSTPHRTGS